jgi:HPt (histidine-containing phosphotransfer) domain-containing protein
VFASETASLLRRMHAALGAGDAPALAEAAHTVKGAAASFGFAALSRVCAAIETKARTSRLAAMAGWLRQADAEFDRLHISRLGTTPAPAASQIQIPENG